MNNELIEMKCINNIYYYITNDSRRMEFKTKLIIGEYYIGHIGECHIEMHTNNKLIFDKCIESFFIEENIIYFDGTSVIGDVTYPLYLFEYKPEYLDANLHNILFK